MASVVLPCCNTIYYPDFDKGGRLVYCPVCGAPNGVEAKPVHTIEYVAYPTQAPMSESNP